MHWKRFGKVITNERSNYYAKPLLIPRDEDQNTLIFTDRDLANCSYIKRGDFSINDNNWEISSEVIIYQKDPADPLEANGIIAMDFMIKDEELILFCTSFHYDDEKNFISRPLFLVLDKKTYTLKRKERFSIPGSEASAGCGAVMLQDNSVFIVYESRFIKNGNASLELKLATSKDFENWSIIDGFSITPAEDEDYVSSPCFVKYKDKLLLAYSLKKDNRYSIAVNELQSLTNLSPAHEMNFLPTATSNWENEETCYPFLFVNNENQLTMLYNGNKYGKTGIGVAVWV